MWFIEVNISVNCTSVWFFPLCCYIRQSRVAFFPEQSTRVRRAATGGRVRASISCFFDKIANCFETHFWNTSNSSYDNEMKYFGGGGGGKSPLGNGGGHGGPSGYEPHRQSTDYPNTRYIGTSSPGNNR